MMSHQHLLRSKIIRIMSKFTFAFLFFILIPTMILHSFIGHEELMLEYLAHQGPLIALINALPITLYQSGEVVDGNCDGDLNHVVQIVGYDLM
jgi:hypothetical protein